MKQQNKDKKVNSKKKIVEKIRKELNDNTTIRSSKICKSSFNKKTDLMKLNRVFMKDNDTISYLDEKDKVHDYPIDINNIISSGTYGVVVNLISKTTKQRFACKLFLKDRYFDDEKYVIDLFKKGNVTCKFIDSIYLSNEKYGNIIVMNTFDGDLSKLRSNLTTLQTEPFIKEIISIFKCLIDYELGYLDIKPENMLFKCVDKNNFIIRLADLGSVTILNRDPGVITYLTFEDRFKFDDDIIPSEEKMLFLIGVFLLDIFKNKKDTVSLFHYSKLQYETKESYLDKVDKIIQNSKLDTFKFKNGISFRELLFNLLDPNPTNRLSLKKILEFLE